MRGSIGGVTVGNGWMYNNPELVYPEGHEDMDERELEQALRAPAIELPEDKPRQKAKRKTITP